MREIENYRETTDQDSIGNGSAGPPRMEWIETYRQTGNVRFVCERFGISKKTFYKWLKRFRESGGDSDSLQDRSRRPHSFPKSTPESVVFLLKQARERTGFGQRRLRVYMAKNYNISISERTIWKILKRAETDGDQPGTKGYF